MSLKLRAALAALLILPCTAFGADLVSNESLKVKLGGFFYGAAHYDTNASATRPWLITVAGDSDRAAFSADPYGTRLNLSVESQAKETVQARGFVEMDWGTVTSPRLRHAYVSVDVPNVVGVLVGQYWLPNLPVNADTFSPNYMNKQGNAWSRTPQLTLFRNFGSLKAMVTVAQASAVAGSITRAPGIAGTYAYAEQALPVGFVQLAYSLNAKSFVSASAGTSRLLAAYSGTDLPSTTDAVTSYADVGTNLAFGNFSGGAKLFYSRGLGLGTGVGQSLVVDSAGEAAVVPSYGGIVSTKYAFTPAVFAAAYAGLDNPADTVRGVALPIRRNFTVGGNVGWNAVDGAQLALEVMRVATVNSTTAGAVTSSDVRGSLVGRYNF